MRRPLLGLLSCEHRQHIPRKSREARTHSGLKLLEMLSHLSVCLSLWLAHTHKHIHTRAHTRAHPRTGTVCKGHRSSHVCHLSVLFLCVRVLHSPEDYSVEMETLIRLHHNYIGKLVWTKHRGLSWQAVHLHLWAFYAFREEIVIQSNTLIVALA